MNLGYLFAKNQLYQIIAMQPDIVIVTAMSWMWYCVTLEY